MLCQGNGRQIWYTPDRAGSANTALQIREGVFYRTDERNQDLPATREYIMMVLENIDFFLIGCVV